MKNLACAATALAVLAASALAIADDETPTIKEIMQKLHKGADAPLAKLKSELKSDSPDWEKVRGWSGDFERLGASLAKNDPPKGEKAAFDKLADAFHEKAKELDEGSKAKDLAATRGAFQKLSTSCMACHRAHR